VDPPNGHAPAHSCNQSGEVHNLIPPPIYRSLLSFLLDLHNNIQPSQPSTPITQTTHNSLQYALQSPNPPNPANDRFPSPTDAACPSTSSPCPSPLHPHTGLGLFGIKYQAQEPECHPPLAAKLLYLGSR